MLCKERSDQMHNRGLAPAPPACLKAPPPRRGLGKTDRTKVTAVKVAESHYRRKRELGDEGEQWALAAIIGQLLRVSNEERVRAIDDVSDLLRAGFEGSPVKDALSHAPLARSRDIDEEELIDELTGLLHVSRHSDAFGFDLVGWLPLAPETEPRAICLEVKSNSSEGFHLSNSEWSLAKRFHDEDEGDRYAVLAVLRGKRGGLPASMDLLVDPVRLVESGQLQRDIDGFKIAYRAGLGDGFSADERPT